MNSRSWPRQIVGGSRTSIAALIGVVRWGSLITEAASAFQAGGGGGGGGHHRVGGGVGTGGGEETSTLLAGTFPVKGKGRTRTIILEGGSLR